MKKGGSLYNQNIFQLLIRRPIFLHFSKGSHWGVPIPDPAYCFVRFPYPAYTMYVSNSHFFVISQVPPDLISSFHVTIIWRSGVTLTKNQQSRVTLRPQWDPLLMRAYKVLQMLTSQNIILRVYGIKVVA